MNSSLCRCTFSMFFALICIIFPLELLAMDSKKTLQQKMVEIQKQIDALKSDATKNKNLSDDTAMLNKISEVFYGGSDLSADWHGVGTLEFRKTNKFNSSFDLVDFNPILLVRYQDSFLFRGSLNFAINDQGGTDASLDFANINWFANDCMVLALGKFDSDLGQFIQNLSPAWINKLPDAPVGFNGDQAAPQSEVGLTMRGGIPFREGSKFKYAFFISNGPHAKVDTTNNIINFISTDGYINQNSDFIYGTRLALHTMIMMLEIELGVSGATGRLDMYNAADNITLVQQGRGYNVLGADLAVHSNGMKLLGEIIQQKVNAQSPSIVQSSNAWRAWYLQLSYKNLNTKFEPIVRYGKYISPLVIANQQQLAIGLDYWFAPSIVAKFAYEFNNGLKGTITDANCIIAQVAFGF
jgi:hypothetical protein